MASLSHPRRQRILIVSSHPLFGQGLRSLLHERGASVEVVGMTANTDEAVAALKSLAPDIVIVDYDDTAVNREEFLARFVESAAPMRVVLVSLQETGPAVVYDRRNLAASQVEDWLNGITGMAPAEGGVSQIASSRRGNMRKYGHFVIVGVLVVIVAALVNWGLSAIGLMPIEASQQAVVIDRLFGQHVAVISFLFALIVVFILYSVVVFRRKPGDTSDGDHFEGHTGLEIVWTIAPLAAVLFFAYIGAQALADTRRVDSDALVVKVTASQWSWSFEYPGDGVTSTTLNLPVNRQVLLQLTSTDVIHSFWVPEFRVKQDAIPGKDMVKELRINPTLVGNFKVRCAELCGKLHAYMETPVVVMEQADFAFWIAQQKAAAAANPADRGKTWAAQFGCTACHSVDGAKIIGPTWKGLYGKTETFNDGSTAAVDDAYLHESIVNPSARIVQSYTDLMPKDFGTRLTEDQISDIVEYIKTLK